MSKKRVMIKAKNKNRKSKLSFGKLDLENKN